MAVEDKARLVSLDRSSLWLTESKGLGNVEEHCTHIFLGVKGFIPLVKAVEKSLG